MKRAGEEFDWDRLMAMAIKRDISTIAMEQHAGASLAELAPWLLTVSDGEVVTNKDASNMVCFEFTGLDTDSVPEYETLALAQDINQLMIRQQDEPMVTWWTMRRSRVDDYPNSRFPDPVGYRIDAARRRAFLDGQNYVNRHYLSMSLLPYHGMDKLTARFSHALRHGGSLWQAVRQTAASLMDDQAHFAYTPPEWIEAVRHLEDIAGDVVSSLQRLRFRRLVGDELGGFLHAMLCPESAAQEFVSVNGLLDSCLLEGNMWVFRDFLHMSSGRLDIRNVGVVAVALEGWPERLALGCLDRLAAMPGELTVNVTLRNIPQRMAEKHAETMRDYHNSNKWSWKTIAKSAMNSNMAGAPANPGREQMARAASEYLGRFTRREISAVDMYFCVQCHGRTLDESDALVERVKALFRSVHVEPKKEELHLVSSFSTSLPGSHKECGRWSFFTSEAFAMMAPVHSATIGRRSCGWLTEQLGSQQPCMAVMPTDHATPLYYDPFLPSGLGHGFIVGPAGSGKTVCGGFLWSQFRRYPGAQVFIFDKDRSSRIAVLLQGGNYLDFANEGNETGLRFNPLADLCPRNFERRMQWVELLCLQRGYVLSAEDNKDLETAMRAMLYLPIAMKRLSTVLSHVTKPRLKEALEPWTGSRALAKYFDNERNDFTPDGLFGIEVGKLLIHPQVAAPLMDYCFQVIDAMLESQREQGVVRPTFIYLPEVQQIIRNEQFAPRLQDWLETLRKKAAMVWMDTQSIETLFTSDIWPSLRDNIPNRLFLPNGAAVSESLAPIYRSAFDLTPYQISRIANAVQRRDYFVQQAGNYSRMVQLQFSPEEIAGLRSDTAAQISFDRHYKDRNPGWQDRYIEEMVKL